MRELFLIALAAVAVLAAVFLLLPRGEGVGSSYDWVLTATEARIIGGYGDHFQYDGEGVRPVEGQAVVKVDADTGQGTVEAVIRTTRESGPVVLAQDAAFEGELRLVMKVGAPGTRLAEYIYLHGDTGNEAPVMPKLFNYLAGWAPLDVYEDGRLVYANLGGHFMLSEGSRRPDGTIRKDDGTIYSPKLKAERGFTDPSRTEFHLVAHSTEPDPNNFPPHTVWIHLHFNAVQIEKAKPGPRVIPNHSRSR